MALLTVYDVAAVPPKVTAVAPVKPVPVIVTEVPPDVGPDAGVIPVKTGAPTVMVCALAVLLPPSLEVVR